MYFILQAYCIKLTILRIPYTYCIVIVRFSLLHFDRFSLLLVLVSPMFNKVDSTICMYTYNFDSCLQFHVSAMNFVTYVHGHGNFTIHIVNQLIVRGYLPYNEIYMFGERK